MDYHSSTENDGNQNGLRLLAKLIARRRLRELAVDGASIDHPPSGKEKEEQDEDISGSK